MTALGKAMGRLCCAEFGLGTTTPPYESRPPVASREPVGMSSNGAVCMSLSSTASVI